MRTRNWSIRAKIISLLLVPLATAVVMWALATAVTVGPGLDLLDAQSDLDNIARPGQALVTEVQAERKVTMVYLASPARNPGAMLAQRAKTDTAAKAFHDLADGADARDSATATTRQQVAAVFGQLDSLTAMRGEVDRGSITVADAMGAYSQVLATGYQLFSSLVRLANEQIGRESLAIVNLSRSREALAQEDAVLSAALAGGPLTTTDIVATTQLVGAQRYLFGQSAPALYQTDRDDYDALTAGSDYTRMRDLEDAFTTRARAGEAAPISASAWQAAYAKVAQGLQQLETTASDRLVERSMPTALTIFGRIAVAGLLGLLAVLVTIIATIRIARSLIKRLAGLRQAALELAVDRLPRVVTRLRRGEAVDVANEAPALPYGEDEIGQVGHAFNELQRTAVTSAIDEANVRRGLNEVFLNIARRSQTLLHRQLSILDRMERRADDPTELEDLFRVDHLATRMRRHAEDLVILAGASPGRGWRNPVPIVDVLRGSVSEVEDYARVSIRPMPEIALVGRCVGDVIHLLAELIENATSFSPPHTRVNVGGEMVPHGFAVEIEDRGLGMSAPALAGFNARLSDPPEFDPTNSAQLGLFVVARLAARHGVKVQLRPSPYGGITAVALLPEDLVVSQPATAVAPRQRAAVAALPAAPTSGSNGNHPDAAAAERYRELSTAPRPAIAAPPPAPAPSFTSTAPATAAAAPAAAPVVSRDVGNVPANAPDEAPTRNSGRGAVKERPRHARQEIIQPDPTSTDGLPRRVRQSNLAPQLRDDSGSLSVSQSGDITTPAPRTRSPEDLRAMMTSFQSGMNRGRRDADGVASAEGNDRAPGREAE